MDEDQTGQIIFIWLISRRPLVSCCLAVQKVFLPLHLPIGNQAYVINVHLILQLCAGNLVMSREVELFAGFYDYRPLVVRCHAG